MRGTLRDRERRPITVTFHFDCSGESISFACAEERETARMFPRRTTAPPNEISSAVVIVQNALFDQNNDENDQRHAQDDQRDINGRKITRGEVFLRFVGLRSQLR